LPAGFTWFCSLIVLITSETVSPRAASSVGSIQTRMA